MDCSKELQRWWASYLESVGELEGAVTFYAAAEDIHSIVRIRITQGQTDEVSLALSVFLYLLSPPLFLLVPPAKAVSLISHSDRKYQEIRVMLPRFLLHCHFPSMLHISDTQTSRQQLVLLS